MKKLLRNCLIIVSTVIIFGCASIQPKQTDYTVSGYAGDDISVKVLRHIQFGDGLYEAANPNKVISGFTLEIIAVQNNHINSNCRVLSGIDA